MQEAWSTLRHGGISWSKNMRRPALRICGTKFNKKLQKVKIVQSYEKLCKMCKIVRNV